MNTKWQTASSIVIGSRAAAQSWTGTLLSLRKLNSNYLSCEIPDGLGDDAWAEPILLSDFRFSIPLDSNITGIELEVIANANPAPIDRRSIFTVMFLGDQMFYRENLGKLKNIDSTYVMGGEFSCPWCYEGPMISPQELSEDFGFAIYCGPGTDGVGYKINLNRVRCRVYYDLENEFYVERIPPTISFL